MWLLDTDHISLLLRQDPKVQSELAQRLSQTTVSIITLQEVFNGWIGALNQSDESQAGTIYKYHQLWLAHEFFKAIPVLEFDATAYDRYVQLAAQNPLLRKKCLRQDLRIASVAIVHGATVVTRNRRDFGLVPGLMIEDWSN
jgi:tRNA(fMet)-specific endonuclease VapC